MAPRALVAVEYAWGQRTARVDRAPHGWVVRCSVDGGRDWFAERGDSYTARTVARDWVEGRLQGPHHHPRRRGEGSMRRLVGAGVMAMALLGAAAVHVDAQTMNPRTVEFDVSPDHDAEVLGQPVVTRYELRIYAEGATQPITTADLGKPAGPRASVERAAVFAAMPIGAYVARVAVLGPGGEGVSDPSVPFGRLTGPRAPGVPAVLP